MTTRVYNWSKRAYEDVPVQKTRKSAQGMVQSVADYLKSGLNASSTVPTQETKEKEGVDKDEKVIGETRTGVIKEISHGSQTNNPPQTSDSNEAEKPEPVASQDSSVSENRSEVESSEERKEFVPREENVSKQTEIEVPKKHDEIQVQEKQPATPHEIIKKYKNKINNMKSEMALYQAKLHTLSQKDKEIQDLKEQLHAALKKQKKSTKDYDKSKKLKEQIQYLEERNRDLSEQLKLSYSQEAWCQESQELNKVYEQKLQQCQVQYETDKENLSTEIGDLKRANTKMEEELTQLRQELANRDQRLKMIADEFNKSQQKWKQEQAEQQALKQPIPSPRSPIKPVDLESVETQTSPFMEPRQAQAPPPSAESQAPQSKSETKEGTQKPTQEGPPAPPPFPENLFRRRMMIPQFQQRGEIPAAPPLPRYFHIGVHQHFSRPHVK